MQEFKSSFSSQFLNLLSYVIDKGISYELVILR